MCVCLSVCHRERGVYVCVFECVSHREGECVCVFECVSQRERENVCVHVCMHVHSLHIFFIQSE